MIELTLLLRFSADTCFCFVFQCVNLNCRCYSDELANKTIGEIREIYSQYSNPSCSKYQGDDSLLSSDFYRNETEHCDRWIYELDHGYKSMSSEVSESKISSLCLIHKNNNLLVKLGV